MKILVYGINYAPELVGIGKYTAEMCEWFAARGHEVHVITAMPFYPSWQVFEPFRGKFWHTKSLNGVTVHRCPLYVPRKVSGTSRILHEVSFVISSSVFWLRHVFLKYDVVMCMAPPLQLGLAGIVYKIFHRSLVVYHIQDLQLDAAKQLGLIKNNWLLNLISSIEQFILRKSDCVSTISKGMMNKLVSKGVDEAKLIELRNWIDTKTFSPARGNGDVRAGFSIAEGQRIVLYSGNLGEKQGIEMILDVAERLNSTAVTFLIIGDGAVKDRIEKAIALGRLSNVKLYPLQPLELLADILNMADLHLVLQKKAAADLVLPSKLTTILSVGGCAVVTAEPGTTLYEIVAENKMGILVEPENPEALQKAIVSALDTDLTGLRANARAYAVSNLEKEIVLQGFESFLKTRIQN